ncbi:hypothetical protein N7475_003198 [Penicillium sp. IBT 31633x]|nr:hypothetical protein N7475_003198 [Penicillium sp. IBT 31633x]
MDKSAVGDAKKLFADSRGNFVVYLQGLSTGDPSGQDVATIQSQLRRVAHTLSTWSEVHDPNKTTCICFVDRCSNFAAVLTEIADLVIIRDGQIPVTVMKIFNMLAMQVGRLTLDDRREDDEYAMKYDRMAKEEDRRWQIGSQGPDDGRAELLFGLWTRMNRISEPNPNCTFECHRVHVANL